MMISGVISLLIILTLFLSMKNYIQKTERADSAVKICQMDVNSAARSIREMALNPDKSTYPTYRQTVEDTLTEVDSELKALKATGLIDDTLYNQYAQSLNDWGTIGYQIIEMIEGGNIDDASDAILNQCTQLKEVAESSRTITQEVSGIADALDSQTTAIHQINVGVDQINDVVQTNSATSEECAAASQEMSSEADSLRELIRRLNVAKL